MYDMICMHVCVNVPVSVWNFNLSIGWEFQCSSSHFSLQSPPHSYAVRVGKEFHLNFCCFLHITRDILICIFWSRMMMSATARPLGMTHTSVIYEGLLILSTLNVRIYLVFWLREICFVSIVSRTVWLNHVFVFLLPDFVSVPTLIYSFIYFF